MQGCNNKDSFDDVTWTELTNERVHKWTVEIRIGLKWQRILFCEVWRQSWNFGICHQGVSCFGV